MKRKLLLLVWINLIFHQISLHKPFMILVEKRDQQQVLLKINQTTSTDLTFSLQKKFKKQPLKQQQRKGNQTQHFLHLLLNLQRKYNKLFIRSSGFFAPLVFCILQLNGSFNVDVRHGKGRYLFLMVTGSLQSKQQSPCHNVDSPEMTSIATVYIILL